MWELLLVITVIRGEQACSWLVEGSGLASYWPRTGLGGSDKIHVLGQLGSMYDDTRQLSRAG